MLSIAIKITITVEFQIYRATAFAFVNRERKLYFELHELFSERVYSTRASSTMHFRTVI